MKKNDETSKGLGDIFKDLPPVAQELVIIRDDLVGSDGKAPKEAEEKAIANGESLIGFLEEDEEFNLICEKLSVVLAELLAAYEKISEVGKRFNNGMYNSGSFFYKKFGKRVED